MADGQNYDNNYCVSLITRAKSAITSLRYLSYSTLLRQLGSFRLRMSLWEARCIQRNTDIVHHLHASLSADNEYPMKHGPASWWARWSMVSDVWNRSWRSLIAVTLSHRNSSSFSTRRVSITRDHRRAHAIARLRLFIIARLHASFRFDIQFKQFACRQIFYFYNLSTL